MPKIKLNNNNIGRKKIQSKRKVINKRGQKSDILLKKMNGNGKNTRERGFVAKLPKFNYDENGNTPVRKGAKLTIQNEISKLPMLSLDPDHDEKPRSITSEASSSSIETNSTVTAAPEIKKHVHQFFSCIDNSTLRKILKNNRLSLQFLSNKLSNEDIDSEVGKETWKDLYEKIDKEEDCKKLFYLIKKIATIFSLVKKCDDDGGYLPDNFRECFDENKINYPALCQDGHGPMVKLYELYDQIGQLKEEKLDILNFYEEKNLESFEDEEEQNLDFLLDQDIDVIDDNINKCEIMALKATKAELYSTLRN